MGRFCQDLVKLKEIQLLPYHRLGIETYQRLSIPYTLEHLGSLKESDLLDKAAILKKMGLAVQIGS